MSRKPLIVLIALGVLAVALLVVGVGAGARDRQGDGGWRERLAGLVTPGTLRPQDLALRSGACAVSADTIAFALGCGFAVPPSGGSFALSDVTRRARLTVGKRPVRVTVTVEGTTIAQTMDPGDDVALTFGRDGGAITLDCLTAPQTCQVTIGEDAHA